MGGKRVGKEMLNNTLLFIIKLLNDNNINNWFIGYGTLLGIIRDNSCIHGDDDIDIIIDASNYDKITNLMIKNGLIKWNINRKVLKTRNIFKTVPTKEYCSVDFYMAQVNKENGNFHDRWEKVIWSNCYDNNNKLIEYPWRDNILYVPCNAETKLLGRYGPGWRTPQRTKGPKPRKGIL